METPDTGFKADDDADDDNLVRDDDTEDDIAGDDEAPLLAASGLCGKHALTHRAPDTWDEHHPALHEGDQHGYGYVGQDDNVGDDLKRFSPKQILVCKFSFIPVQWYYCPNFATANIKANLTSAVIWRHF